MPLKIGILGGGQLARMSAFEAIRLGFSVNILEKTKNSPAGQLSKNEFVGWIDNKNILKKFINNSDIITLENEFIDSEVLKWIEDQNKKVVPSSRTISLIQDKLVQKQTFQKAKLPLTEFINISDESNYFEIKQKLGGKFILKSRKLGYDGYGNAIVYNEKDFDDALKKLKQRHAQLLAEKFIDFEKELAIIIARTKKDIKAYPVVETIQKNHICHLVIAPAQIDNKLIKDTIEIAIEAIKAVKGYGLFGLEFFLTKDAKILINEIAPRPHNSGHYSIEACVTSQFENHIRSILNLPLGSTEMVYPYSVMINLLGKRNGKNKNLNISNVLKFEDAHLHIYGKEQSRKGRKMGHITFCGNDLKTIYNKAILAEREIII